ncbi:MAG: hypothetical protein OXU61_02915 [Gammaproteobacteria bacterium]|nr:hypothetical protein [Gammaproteobacteria bacterium]
MQRLTIRPSLNRIFLHRSAKRALSMRDSGFRRNDMEEAGMTRGEAGTTGHWASWRGSGRGVGTNL